MNHIVMRKKYTLMCETTITGLSKEDYHSITELEGYRTFQEAKQALFSRCQRLNNIDEKVKAWMEGDEMHEISTLRGKLTRHIWIEEK